MKYARRRYQTIFIGLFIAFFCITIGRILMQELRIISSLKSTFNNNFVKKKFILEKYHKNSENGIALTRSEISSNLSILNSSSIKLLSDNVINYSSTSTDYEKLQNDKLIDLNSFKYLINQPPCPIAFKKNLPPLILILVHSAWNNYQKRTIIRETWGSLNSSKLRILFLLGAVVENSQQTQIELENNKFADIVQGNFIDHYRNMTYKHVMALQWFTYHCPNAKYLLKVDDDIFVNTPQLIEFLKEENVSNPIINNNTMSNNQQQNETNLPNHNLIFCEITNLLRVRRSYRSKWRVSTKEYSGRYYPPYCPGYSITYSSDVVFKLYKLAQNSKYFWIDDVHITGTMAQLANITLTSSTEYFLPADIYRNLFYIYLLSVNRIINNAYPENEDVIINDFNIPIINNFNIPMFLFSWPERGEEEIRFLWKFIFGFK